MPSLDYDKEKSIFREFYSDHINIMNGAKISFCALINALLTHSAEIPVAKIEGRVKDKEECIRKFNLKYRRTLEDNETVYSIKDHISDLIGLRVVCLYEDDIEKIKAVLQEQFDVIDITDKTLQIESTEGSFGYKGLHLDLKLGESRKEMPEYKAFSNYNFEIQIRTIIQDSWSVLDHKIKYKKSIPNQLKRRINTLAALFELADREFREIRSSTDEEIKKVEKDDPDNIALLSADGGEPEKLAKETFENGNLNAFGFLKIARHFFQDYDFKPDKVDDFTEEIILMEPEISRTKLNEYLKSTISIVKQYKQYSKGEDALDEKLDAFTVMRHCLYLSDRDVYSAMLTKASKKAFEDWLHDHG